MNRTWIIARILFATLIYTPNLFGQGQGSIPNRTLGIGVTVGSMTEQNSSVGGHVAFAMTEKLHLGSQVGFSTGSSENGDSDSYILIAPYAKFLFPLRNDFTPFLIGQVIVDNGGTSYEYVLGQEGISSSNSRSSLYFGGGAEYFPTPGLGVYGYIGFIDIGLDPKGTQIGLLQPRVGVEWFLH